MLKKVFLTILFVEIFCRADSREARIGSGRDSKPNENLDYVLLNIVFQNQMQRCGGSLIAPQYVLTSATCVFDPVEGVATVVNATFPLFRPLEFVNSNLKITIHPNYNKTNHADDIAIIKLMTPMTIDGRTVAVAALGKNETKDIYVNSVLTACGFGSITNYPRLPKVLQCTELYGVTAANCSSNSNIICTQWLDRDNNMCNGDYGGPLYSSIESVDKVSQTLVGIAQYSPDYRSAASCLDAHKVSHAQVAAYINWITQTLT